MSDVWESAGWEPREDQLSWQQYEVAAAGGAEDAGRQSRKGRRRSGPLITDRAASRQFLVKLSTLPWSEQRKVKEKLDQLLTGKKVGKKSEKLPDSMTRQSGLPARLELKQVGRSVKYMKAQERSAVRVGGSEEDQITVGQMSGEWEQEFSFVCCVCAIEYDDVLEIMHHKWEFHPHCLVTHVSLREGMRRPPALLYPQVDANL